jgi:CubicO group peptidase (beta-lactamase class C family)
MLANMTAGYTDYVTTEAFAAANAADPFRRWTPDELIAIGLDAGRFFAPGESWAYSHTDYVILGLAMEQITGESLDKVLRDLVLDPLGLVNTASFGTPEIPEPVLHAFTSERKSFLQIPSGVRFYEEATFWDPSWTIARGAIQTTTIADLAASAAAIGDGVLLSPASSQAQTSSSLAGFGVPIEGCATCMTLSDQAPYGLGIWVLGDWLAQNPAFGGYAAFMAYLPARKLAIAVAATVNEAAFDDQGNALLPNASVPVGVAIASLLAPDVPLAGGNRAP